VLDGTLDEIQSTYGQDTVRVKVSGGRTALSGFSEIDSVNDYGNYQDLRLNADPQAFLQKLTQKMAVQHFELTKPSLHDIFVRIAQPTPEDLKRPAGGANS
jgi:ABC-2 type transport system ATP-binding protein